LGLQSFTNAKATAADDTYIKILAQAKAVTALQ
jgi:hypothetical protein